MKLDDPGIIKIVGYLAKGEVEKKDGSTYEVVCVIVQDYAIGGELFFFVKNSGYFEERHARYFFH